MRRGSRSWPISSAPSSSPPCPVALIGLETKRAHTNSTPGISVKPSNVLTGITYFRILRINDTGEPQAVSSPHRISILFKLVLNLSHLNEIWITAVVCRWGCIWGLNKTGISAQDRGPFWCSYILNEILQYIEIWNEFKVWNDCPIF